MIQKYEKDNWVKLFLGVNDNGANYRNYKITGIKDDYGTLKIRIDQTDTWFHTGNFEPIHLTENILLNKCKFELYPWGFVKEGCPLIRFSKLPKEKYWCELGNGFRIELPYLHTLQNFIALTQQELNIDL